MTSKLSRAKPGGSILAWQAAHDARCRCLASCSRIVVAPRMSGSTASTSGGGLGGGVPRMRSSTHAPRRTGEVVVPLAVTFSTLAIVSTPPRWLSGGSSTLRNSHAFHAGDAVVLRQPAVEHREVGGHEIRQAQVVLEHLVEEQLRLLDHRHLEHVVEFRIEDVVGLGGVDVAQAKPLADEVLGEGRRLGVLRACARPAGGACRVGQLALFGEVEQFLVGHRAPQEVRQPAGQGEVVELAGLLAKEQEMRRHQDGLAGRRASPARTSTSRPAWPSRGPETA